MDAYKNAHVNTIDAVLLLMEQKKEEIIFFAPAIGSAILALIDKRTAITVCLSNASATTVAVTERKQARNSKPMHPSVKNARNASSTENGEAEKLIAEAHAYFRNRRSAVETTHRQGSSVGNHERRLRNGDCDAAQVENWQKAHN